jgi:hypothetical protein
MAEKEATVYIVDMGRSMGECHHGRPITDLEWAMQYVWDRITATVCDLTLLYTRELIIPGGYRSQDCYSWRGWSQDRW